MSEALLRAENVCKRFQTGDGSIEVLKGADLEVRARSVPEVRDVAPGPVVKLQTLEVRAHRVNLRMVTGEVLHIDAGYRYLNMGNAQTGTISADTDNDGLPDTTLQGIEAEDVTAHEFRIGLRFDIW